MREQRGGGMSGTQIGGPSKWRQVTGITNASLQDWVIGFSPLKADLDTLREKLLSIAC